MSRSWFNGAVIDGVLPVSPDERGLTLGDGLFETMLVVNRVALWRNMHLARMQGGALELGLAFDRDAVDAAIDTLLGETAADHQVLRVTLTRGVVRRGLAGPAAAPSLLVTVAGFDPGLMFRPATVLTSAIRRSTSSPAARLKTLSYIDNVLAAREAAARGLDDALLLNTAGFAACSTIANLFLLKDGVLVTPARDQAILTGVMRQALLALAHQRGLGTAERPVAAAELATADAVFLTNSLRFIRPVTMLDGVPLAQADLGFLADALCETARLQCGRDPRLI